jgi:hypothetical protein
MSPRFRLLGKIALPRVEDRYGTGQDSAQRPEARTGSTFRDRTS